MNIGNVVKHEVLGESPVITRKDVSTGEDISVALVPAVFGKRSEKNAGKPYWKLPFTVTNLHEMIKFLGTDEAVDTFDTQYSRTFMDIALEAIDETTGVMDTEKYLEDLQNFTAGRQKLSDIDTALDSYVEEQQKIVSDDNFQVDTDGTPVSPEMKALVQRMKEIKEQIRALKIKRASIEAVYKERAAKRQAKKAAATKTA